MLYFVEELVKIFTEDLKKIKELRMRVCRMCEISKDVKDFPNKKGKPDGYYCKKCFYIKYKDTSKNCSKKYYENNKEECVEKAREYREINKYSLSVSKKEYYLKNKDEIISKNSVYCKENKERRNELARENYHKNNLKENKRIYTNNRLKNDPLFKLIFNTRTLIRNSIKRQYTEKSKKTKEILGCSFEEFKIYLEEQFDENMNWDNQGSYWHMDHKKPISLAMSEEEVYELNHYTNFQPLYWEDNLTKGNKYNF
jgi:hypothetical protein